MYDVDIKLESLSKALDADKNSTIKAARLPWILSVLIVKWIN